MRNKLKTVKSKFVRSLCSSFGVPHRNARKDEAIARIEEFVQRQFVMKNYDILYAMKDIISLAVASEQIPTLGEYMRNQNSQIQTERQSQIVFPSANDLTRLTNKKSDTDPYISLFRKSHFYKFKQTIYPDSGYPILTVKSTLKRRNTTRINFTLNKSEVDLIKKSNYSVYLFCGTLDDDRTDKIIYFPYPSNVECNGLATHANTKGIRNKHGTTNPVNLTKFLKYDETNRLTIVYRESPEQIFEFYLYLVEEVSIEKVESKVLDKPHIIRDDTVKLLNGDGELELSGESVQLLCPCSFVRIKIPVRLLSCKHVQCFDLSSFLNLQQKIPTWECPVCSDPILLKNLRIDDYFQVMLNEIDEKFDYAIVKSDGSFVPKLVGTDTEYKTVSRDLEGVTNNNVTTDIKLEENIVIKNQEVGVVDLTSDNVIANSPHTNIDDDYPRVPLAEGEEDDEEELIIPSKIKHLNKKFQSSAIEQPVVNVEPEVIVLDSDSEDDTDHDQSNIPAKTAGTHQLSSLSLTHSPQTGEPVKEKHPPSEISTSRIINDSTRVDPRSLPTAQVVSVATKQASNLQIPTTSESASAIQGDSEPPINSLNSTWTTIPNDKFLDTEHVASTSNPTATSIRFPTSPINNRQSQDNEPDRSMGWNESSMSSSLGNRTMMDQTPDTVQDSVHANTGERTAVPGKIVFKKVGPAGKPFGQNRVSSIFLKGNQSQKSQQPPQTADNSYNQSLSLSEMLQSQKNNFECDESFLKRNVSFIQEINSSINEYQKNGLEVPSMLLASRQQSYNSLIELGAVTNRHTLQCLKIVAQSKLTEGKLIDSYLKLLCQRIDKHASFEYKMKFYIHFQRRKCYNYVLTSVLQLLMTEIERLLAFNTQDYASLAESINNIFVKLSTSFSSPNYLLSTMYQLGLLMIVNRFQQFNFKEFPLASVEIDGIKSLEMEFRSFDSAYLSNLIFSFNHFSQLDAENIELESKKKEDDLRMETMTEREKFITIKLREWIHLKYANDEKLCSSIESIGVITKESLKEEMHHVIKEVCAQYETFKRGSMANTSTPPRPVPFQKPSTKPSPMEDVVIHKTHTAPVIRQQEVQITTPSMSSVTTPVTQHESEISSRKIESTPAINPTPKFESCNEQTFRKWVLESKNAGTDKQSLPESKVIFDKQWQFVKDKIGGEEKSKSASNERVISEDRGKTVQLEEDVRIAQELEVRSRKEEEVRALASRAARVNAEQARIQILEKGRIEKEEIERKAAEERVRAERVRRESIEKGKIEAAAKARAAKELEEAVRAKKGATEENARVEKEAAEEQSRVEQEAAAKVKELRIKNEKEVKKKQEHEAGLKREATEKKRNEEKARIQREANEREALEREKRKAREAEIVQEQVKRKIMEAEAKAKELEQLSKIEKANLEKAELEKESEATKNSIVTEFEKKKKMESSKQIIQDPAGANRKSNLLPPLPPPSYSPPPSMSHKKKHVTFVNEIKGVPLLPASIPKAPSGIKNKESTDDVGDQLQRMNQLKKLVAEGKQRKADKEKQVNTTSPIPNKPTGTSSPLPHDPFITEKVHKYRESFMKVSKGGSTTTHVMSNGFNKKSNDNDLCKSIEEISRAKIENDLAGRSNDVRKKRYIGIDEFSNAKNKRTKL